MWWIMVSLTAIVGGLVVAELQEQQTCEDAHLKCAYRDGCGMALNNYMIGCSAVLQGPEPTKCPEVCQHALIALTSTKEGKELMSCKCSDNFCEDVKRRVEVCRPEVVKANQKETIVSCEVAHWICAADNTCSTALYYYHKYCKSMFHGVRCTYRCINSINILSRQEQAFKLQNCKCDGREDYNCQQIRSNMKNLCFKSKHKKTKNITSISSTTTPSVISDPGSSGNLNVTHGALFLIFITIMTGHFALT